MNKPDPKTIDRILNRGVAEVIPKQELLQRLTEGTPLRRKMGFDPSRPDLHLGHVVGLRKLRQLQDLGHQVVLIVGDWTAQIGDPSGQSDTRSMLSAEEVQANAETYMRQFFRVVDESKTEARYQTEWFGKFDLADVVRLTSHFTVNQFLHRNDFADRFQAERPIAVTELLYPLMQAYDSVVVEADVEFGGTDQLFNLMVGRELQEKMGKRPQIVFTMPILPGTDGVRRMGKSLGNYIAIEDTPADMFGKVMSLPDKVLPLYFELLTETTDEDIQALREGIKSGSMNPMNFKKTLAREMVSEFHSAPDAQTAQEEFERVVQRREIPSEIPLLIAGADTPGVLTCEFTEITADLPRFLVGAGLADSRSQAQRIIDQKAVSVNGITVVTERGEAIPIEFGSVIQVGRRRFVRLAKA